MADSIDRAVAAIEQTAATLADWQAELKDCAMQYQFALKCEVAAALGVTYADVNLPYAQWAAIRDKYLADQGEQPCPNAKQKPSKSRRRKT